MGLVALTAILVSSVFTASGTAVSAQPVEVWNVTENSLSQGRAIAISGGSVYMAGMTDSIDANANASLNKYNSTDGTLIWNITWGGAGRDVGWATATDGSGVYLAGEHDPAGKIDSVAFLNKYGSNGTLIWNITWGGTGDTTGNAVATASDCVYIAGDVELSHGSVYYVFLNKYDKDGTLIWNVTWGGPDFYASFAKAATTGDYVYLAGDTTDKIFLNKYDKDGNLTWNITWGETTCMDFGVYAIATGDRAVYLAGTTCSDAFLNKYDEDGTLIWNTTWVNTTGLVTATCDNAVYLAGWSGNPFGSPYAFLNKYNSTDGTLIWNTTLANASGYATATGDNAVYLAGSSGGNEIALMVKFSDPTPTPAPAAPPTQASSPTTTPAVPGFEAIFAIMGLLAVAYLVMVRRK